MVLYIALFVIAGATGCDNVARDFYASSGNKLFANLSSEAEIIGLPHEDLERGTNILFHIRSKKMLEEVRNRMRQTGETNVNVETQGFYTSSRPTILMPLVLLLSLILAYHSSIKRKGIAIALGIPLILLYAFFKLGCSLIYTIDESEQYFPDYELSAFSNSFLEVVNGLIIDGAYVVVFLIWILVCVRFEDFGLEKTGA